MCEGPFQMTDIETAEIGQLDKVLYNLIYLLTAIGLSPGGSTHLHTKTIHRTTQITTKQPK
jgi:hypothetical protein